MSGSPTMTRFDVQRTRSGEKQPTAANFPKRRRCKNAVTARTRIECMSRVAASEWSDEREASRLSFASAKNTRRPHQTRSPERDPLTNRTQRHRIHPSWIQGRPGRSLTILGWSTCFAKTKPNNRQNRIQLRHSRLLFNSVSTKSMQELP